MQPTLADIQAARASARRKRNHNARRLKRIILKLMTRVEAYEHELDLLTRVERDLVANGKAEPFALSPSLFAAPPPESRFNAPSPLPAPITLPESCDAPSAIRRVSPMPTSESLSQWISGPMGQWDAQSEQPTANLPTWSSPETAEITAQHYAAGDGF